ncbi:SRPBCC family protein [uncultured Jatrophihabitans sp.]|uniref:SRPBCC family protein n=1 Tax=uncultured Jatrophihabitans sp. TaxID=1610747 RepID=UPI0035CC673D
MGGPSGRVRQFDELPAWHPVIASSSLDSGQEGQVGAVRRLTTGDGGVVVERLITLDDEAHRLTYAIEQSPFPIRG